MRIGMFDDNALSQETLLETIVTHVSEHAVAMRYRQIGIDVGNLRANTNDKWLEEHGDSERERLGVILRADPKRIAFRLKKIAEGYNTARDVAEAEVRTFPTPEAR
jgi:hypothetical protein